MNEMVYMRKSVKFEEMSQSDDGDESDKNIFQLSLYFTIRSFAGSCFETYPLRNILELFVSVFSFSKS